MTDWDVIVIGAGPAGLSAALMLGRSLRKVLVIDAGQPRNRFADQMHGVLGFEGESPATLLQKGRQEVAQYGVVVESGEVAEISEGDDHLIVTRVDGSTTTCRVLIAATGLTDQLLDIPGLAECWGASILHCPYCHGWEVRGKKLVVLGTNPMAVHQAQLVRQLSDDVTLLTNGADIVDEPTRARLQMRGVEVMTQPVVEVVRDDKQVKAVELADGTQVEAEAIFTMGNSEYHDEFLSSLGLERAESPMGSILKVDELGTTSNPRVFAVGNVNAAHANVPLSMGLGSFAGAGANMALVKEDFDRS